MENKKEFTPHLLRGNKKVSSKYTGKGAGFTTEDARRIGDAIGIDWDKYDLEQFRIGLRVELEHGTVDPQTNVTDDDEVMTGKIALAHLKEISDYYTRLEEMEEEAEK